VSPRRSGFARFAPAALCALLALPAFASEEAAGTRAATFLSAGDAPAVLGMGGASLALGRDVQAAGWNPAALGWVATPQASLAHADFTDQTSREWFAFGSRLGRGRTRVGVSALVHDLGTLDGRDAGGQPTGDVRAQDLAFALRLARPIGQHVALGGAAHFVSQRIGDVGGRGLAFDAGAQVRLGVVSLALAGRDFGGGMMWDHVRWAMPANLGAGIALEHAASGLRAALDWNAPADYYRNWQAGAEWRWHDRLALRGGWRHDLRAPGSDQLGGPAFGMGAGVGAFWVDYGYVLESGNAVVHRVGLSLHGGSRPAPPPAPGPAPAPQPVTVPR
jgi:hypothetical protein